MLNEIQEIASLVLTGLPTANKMPRVVLNCHNFWVGLHVIIPPWLASGSLN
jgi:hypothetical protein